MKRKEVLSKNHSKRSLEYRVTRKAAGEHVEEISLTGGDAEVAIWERLWQRHKKFPSVLEMT